MKAIATLGPPGTFSDIATQKYLHHLGHPENFTIRYYRSIKQAFHSVGAGCDYGVLPIENLSEGFVQVVLDLLQEGDLELIHELFLPIHFSFVANASDLSTLEQIYVQFVAKGQCANFLESFQKTTIVSTESNIESLNLLQASQTPAGAIAPADAVNSGDFPTLIENVGDYRHNTTRFVTLAPQGIASYTRPEAVDASESKTSLVILDDNDYPGLLVSLLGCFSKRSINLRSIMSRPTRAYIGKYHFFIDIEGHQQDPLIREAIAEVAQLNKVKVLGSYPAAQYPETVDSA